MCIRLSQVHRALPAILGLLTLASVGVLFAWDAFPRLFPIRAHDVLAAFPLAMIAVAYLVYQSTNRPSRIEAVKGILLAVAFLFWAANQLWPDLRQATLFTTSQSRSSSSIYFWSSSAGRIITDRSFARNHAPSPTRKEI